MSKYKKNTIDPENIINQYGADAVRFFILADSPPEKDIQWSDSGMISAYKFIQKFWLLNQEILRISKLEKLHDSEDLEIFTNQIIDRINHALEKFRYNVIIAIYHEVYSFFKKFIEINKNYQNLKSSFEKILILMTPVIPHISNECLKNLGSVKQLKWPEIDHKFLKKENNEIVIQVNGKKRNTILIEKDMDEKNIKDRIINEKLIEKYIKNGELIKTIYVKNRLINYIIK